ncbi:MAG: HEAT repeat domain-containing protein, partial [Armatimonadetes bacterium]|nr:HEAT repeat domain-containing protein [Armatimonadota bacterium]
MAASHHAGRRTTNRTCLLVVLVCLLFAALLVSMVLFSWGVIRHLPGHIAMTKSPVYMVRMGGCMALAHYAVEPQRSQAVQALVACLSDSDHWVRSAAVDSLVT